jgi:DNA-binding LytR/AlgR family response regulator
MKALQVLIADDEPIAGDILRAYVERMPMLQLAGVCRNAFEAQQALAAKPVDLLLLDINMPHLSGIDLLRSLRNPPMTIFTTAYAEFAVQSYELNAVDYLLKPIAFDRFFMAVSKAINLSRGQSAAAAPEPVPAPKGDNVMFVKSNGKLVKIDLDKLWLVEALGDYLRLFVDAEQLVVYSTLKNMESQLAFLPAFVRISKSHIVNIRFVSEIEGNAVRIRGQHYLIGPTYRDKVNKVLESYKML